MTMKILLASPEVAPFAKTGGLADVAGALPKALERLGHDIRVILPLYRMVDKARFPLKRALRLDIPFAGRLEEAELWEARTGREVPVYFLRNDHYYNREHLYQTPEGDYPDNGERFAFFSKGLLEACKALQFQPDVIHCNDWQTGLVPVYLKTLYRDDPFFQGTATLFTIHNLAYQGLFEKEILPFIGLPWDLFTTEGLEFYGKVNLLKGGLIFADILTTVSRRYSQEIQTEAFGCGLEGVLRARHQDLFGVLNGVDYEEWHPATDPHIAKPYTREDLSGKVECKKDLQLSVGLPVREDLPVAGVVTRLVAQKGIDLIATVLEEMLALDLQLVLLGTGEERYHAFFQKAANTYPDQVAVKLGFDLPLSHKIEAGCDLFLMPSRFEPCGLNQMYSLLYGTVPIVRATGGLDDTIIPFDPETGKGNGFKFSDPSPEQLLKTVCRAVFLFKKRKDLWITLVRNGMEGDFSWERSAREYERLYRLAKERASRSSG